MFNSLINTFSSRRIQYSLKTIFLSFMMLVFLRMIFFIMFFEPNSFSTLIKSLWFGIRFDLRLAILFNFPLFILCIIATIKYWKFSYTIFLSKYIYPTIITFIIFFYVFDFSYYSYTQQRIDITVYSLMENPSISVGMIWETYPVLILFSLILLLCILMSKVHLVIINQTLMKQSRNSLLKNKLIQIIFTFIVGVVGIWGSFSQYALLWSDAFFNRDPFVSAIALNPLLYFYDTTTFSEKNYNIEDVKDYYPLMTDYLGVNNPNISNLNFDRYINSTLSYEKSPNVVIIFMESVGLNRMGLVGNPLNPTPTLDSLANSGLFFPNFYVPWVSTSRSVFTMLTGIPDVARKTSSRNPIVRDQYSIISQFVNYDKHYMIGGSASWANIRSLIQYNIKDMNIIEMEDIDRPRVDVWGVSDLDLFREANLLLKNRTSQNSTFTIIQTAGNHRPYTIPEDNDGFIVQNHAKDLLNNAGFKSQGQFNAVRLLDHSIGKFLNEAKKLPFFDNTIFVLFGDHGTADPHALHMPPDDYGLRLRSYNVPLIIYAPNIIREPKIIETISGLADLMPTVASLCDLSYKNKTMGRDILSLDKNTAFIVNKKISPSSYGFLNNDYYLRIFRNGSGMELHDMRSINPEKNVIDSLASKADSLLKITNAYYETAKYMIHHNDN